MNFPDPLKQLYSELPEVDDMPYFSSKSAAGVALLKEFPDNLLDSPKIRDLEKLGNSTTDKLKFNCLRHFQSNSFLNCILRTPFS